MEFKCKIGFACLLINSVALLVTVQSLPIEVHSLTTISANLEQILIITSSLGVTMSYMTVYHVNNVEHWMFTRFIEEKNRKEDQNSGSRAMVMTITNLQVDYRI